MAQRIIRRSEEARREAARLARAAAFRARVNGNVPPPRPPTGAKKGRGQGR